MPHPELSPPLIDADGRIRTLLERADRFPIALEPQLPLAAVTPVERARRWPLRAGWADAVPGLPVNRDLMLAFTLGFVVSAAVVMIGVAARPIQIAAALPASIPEPPVHIEARTGTFAAPSLLQIAVATVARPVATAPVAAVAAPTPTPASVAQPRIAELPRYAGLSTGATPAGGNTLVDIAVAPNLGMMDHAALPAPQAVDIELIGIDGRPVVTAAPARASNSSGPEVVAIEVPVPVRATRPTSTPAFSAPANVEAVAIVPPALVTSSPVTTPQPLRVAAAAPATPSHKPHVAHAKPKPKPKAIVPAATETKEVVKVAAKPAKAPPKPDAEPKIAVARPSKSKPTSSMAAADTSPPIVYTGSTRLPWSHSWMRSSLGMGESGR